MKKVLIVDDERCIQRLYQMDILSAADRYCLAGAVTCADNAKMFCETNEVDLILMDINTADNASGIDATAQIKRIFPKIKIIITTSYNDFGALELAKEAGADSFWFKDFSPVELLEVMDKTIAGENYWPKEMPNIKMGSSFLNQLTKTERELLYHLVECVSIRKIAEKMFVEEVTVKTHLKNIYTKTGCKNKTELLVMVMQAKLVLPKNHGEHQE